MLPVFNEYIKFLKDKGNDKIELTEGYYWYDNSIIKAFDKDGNTHKIMRLKIDDKLNIEFKLYNEKKFEIESWQETINRNKEKLNNIEYESLQLINNQIEKYKNRNIAVLTSGGKDSSVTEYLTYKVCKEKNINFTKIFNNTSLDCADTYLFMKSKPNVLFINPKEGFYQWRERNNFVGNRLARACCTIFKEGAMVETLPEDNKYLFFMGMRNEESNTRSSYGDEWKNEKWGNRDWNACLPIRKWSELDIWLYVLKNNIPVNPKYRKGYSRCGWTL